MIGWMGRHLGRWLDRRLRLAKVVRSAMNHVFPDHWSFMLGEIALYSFVILVITGTFLALFFDASSAKVTYHGSYHALDGITMSAAYRSAIELSFDVRAGLLVRQMHHWAALIFLCAIIAHLVRIFFTAAYRRPREINWMVGVTLLLLALVNGYFGYSLLGDMLSGAGLRIAYAILLSVPFIGRWLAFIALGGTVPNPATTTHMYVMHIWVVPASIATLIALHLGIIWRQMHTNYPGPRRTDTTIVGSRLWPSYAAKSLGLFFLLFGFVAMLGGLVQIDPVLGLRTVRSHRYSFRSATRLVSRLGGRGDTPLPRRQPSFWKISRPRSLLPGHALPRPGFRLLVRVSVCGADARVRSS